MDALRLSPARRAISQLAVINLHHMGQYTPGMASHAIYAHFFTTKLSMAVVSGLEGKNAAGTHGPASFSTTSPSLTTKPSQLSHFNVLKEPTVLTEASNNDFSPHAGHATANFFDIKPQSI
jgi:hypothetical protein